MMRTIQRAMALCLLLPAAAMLTACDDAATPGETVALFYDAAYVDVAAADALEEDSDYTGSEAVNLKEQLEAWGFIVAAFEGGADTDIETATNQATALVLPEPENGSYDDAFDEDAVDAIEAYVSGGGVLVVFDPGYESNLSLLNDAFGWSIAGTDIVDEAPAGVEEDEFVHNTVASEGTPFATGAGTLPHNDATSIVATSTLPEGGLCIYQDEGDCGLAVIPVGNGHVAIMGWDWYDAPPRGSQDAGWTAALRDALRL